SLTFTQTAAPTGMTIDLGSGLILWTPTTAQVGIQTVAFRVEDGRGGVATQSYFVAVNASALDRPPVLTSTPSFAATAGQLYTYAVVASDPDGDVLSFRLDKAPAGMTIDPVTGLVQWTPTEAQAGLQPVIVVAEDPAGAVAR